MESKKIEKTRRKNIYSMFVQYIDTYVKENDMPNIELMNKMTFQQSSVSTLFRSLLNRLMMRPNLVLSK